MYDVILQTLLTVSHDNTAAAGATETLARLYWEDRTCVSPSSENSEQIASFRAVFYRTSSVRGWPTRPTATQFFRRYLERSEDVGLLCNSDSERAQTRDVRPKEVESNANFRDYLSPIFAQPIFVIANNRLDVVVNLLTTPTYVSSHCSVNIEVPSPLESRP